MAIFHLTAKVISRGKGQSAIAAAAYRSGERLRDDATGAIKSYQARASRIVFAGIFAPPNAPAWMRNRNQLWNQVERIERRKDATLARELEIALPHELTDRQRLWLVQDFVRQAFTRKGFVVDVAIHAPDGKADSRNHHAHILIVERRAGPAGFAATKDRSLARKATLRGWRAQWAQLTNRHLARHGHVAQIDHRSLQAQGTGREPTRHLGHVATQMERRGAASRRGSEQRAITVRNMRRQEWRESGFGRLAVSEGPAIPRAAESRSALAVSVSAFAQTASAMTASLPAVEPELRKCAVIRCSATQGVTGANDLAVSADDGGGYEAEAAFIRAMYSARIEGLRRSLPPDQARAAVHHAMEEQRAVLHGLREKRQREAAGRGTAARRSRDRHGRLLEARMP